MKVDFNNLRRSAIDSISDLINKLNDGRLQEDVYGETLDGKVLCGDILLNKNEIENLINRLRLEIISIGLVHVEGDDEFKDVTEDLEVSYFNLDESNDE